MLSLLKRHEVEILLKAGHGKAEVARLAGVSLCSVKRKACIMSTYCQRLTDRLYPRLFSNKELERHSVVQTNFAPGRD